ncbi:MAG: Flp pilus assembly complex ATPase component TadA [Anaerolineae bacterium]|nr:Flp pilus assembly complex ATPase component TadA [Anaerolineae bacterium]
MPVLRRLHDDPPEGTDDRGETSRPGQNKPQIVPGRHGAASFSLAALRERIAAEVIAEVGDQPDVLEKLDETTRHALVREAGEYVLAVEAVRLDRAEKTALFTAVVREVFGLGPLDPLLADDDVTEVVMETAQRCLVRRRMGPLEDAPVGFEDEAHLRRIVERMVRRAGGALQAGEPFLEAGLILAGRPARLTTIAPPLSPALHANLRLHPHNPITLATLAAEGVLNAREETLLRALARSPYGLVVAGDAGSGKTTLLQALLAECPVAGEVWLAQRAAEIRLPEGGHILAATAGTEELAGRSFAETIAAALANSPVVLALDEVRGDEAAALWEALTGSCRPRLLVTFRASVQPVRLRSSLRWLLLQGRPALTESDVDGAILERLPLVIATGIVAGRLHLLAISQWELQNSGGITLMPLLDRGVLTGARPRMALDVPEGFWEDDGQADQ